MQTLDPAGMRARLEAMSEEAREAWLRQQWGDEDFDDDAALPRGCVPYLPCPIGTLLDQSSQQSRGI